MAERGGLWALLSRPWIYEAVQAMFAADRGRLAFVTEHVRPTAGDRILDIGCGTAGILRYLPGVTYIGYEPNPVYVERARAEFGDRGTFHAKLFTASEAASIAPVDIAIVSAVLHHLSDGEAQDLLRLLRGVVKPGGRVVTIDNCYVDGQNPIARLLISLDRGRNVRTPEGYRGLAAATFGTIRGEVSHRAFPPYTFFIMTLS